jgi:hypothetical protein
MYYMTAGVLLIASIACDALDGLSVYMYYETQRSQLGSEHLQ